MSGLLVTYDASAVKAALARFQRTLAQYSDVETLRVAEDSHERITGGRYFQNRTRKTAKSFGARPKKLGNAHYEVASTSLIAKFLNEGTKAHTISVGGNKASGGIRITANRGGSKSAKSLRFFVGGSARFAKTVHHPGTRAIGFQERERSVSQGPLAEAAERAAQRAADLAGL